MQNSWNSAVSESLRFLDQFAVGQVTPEYPSDSTCSGVFPHGLGSSSIRDQPVLIRPLHRLKDRREHLRCAKVGNFVEDRASRGRRQEPGLRPPRRAGIVSAGA
jgi:hypothetical protein